MYMWNFKTPITFLACCVWNFCELFGICYPYAGWLFGKAIGTKTVKIKSKENPNG